MNSSWDRQSRRVAILCGPANLIGGRFDSEKLPVRCHHTHAVVSNQVLEYLKLTLLGHDTQLDTAIQSLAISRRVCSNRTAFAIAICEHPRTRNAMAIEVVGDTLGSLNREVLVVAV